MLFADPSAFRIDPCPRPSVSAVKIPGFDSATDTFTGADVWPPLSTTTSTVPAPATSYGTTAFTQVADTYNSGAGIPLTNTRKLDSSVAPNH